MQNRRNFIKDSFLSLSCIPVLGVIFKSKINIGTITNVVLSDRILSKDECIQNYQEECFNRGLFPRIAMKYHLTPNEVKGMSIHQIEMLK